MILLVLIGAFEPILNVGNLTFILKNLRELTGTKAIIIKYDDPNMCFPMEGRFRLNKSNNYSENFNFSESEFSQQQISTKSMLEVIFSIKRKFIRETFGDDGTHPELTLLGITSMDIYPSNNHEYVFGQSDPDKGIAIISGHRLYQKDINEVKMSVRLLKVVMHEYFHLLKLSHCNQDCIMSTTIEH
ncbi:hypothetical protein FG386_003251 [Cryptosporidium ryanae]|uniref:uncharacterized protein n=1 Tax=Cryptosporidium ryanae TaxID=515981 RepID=UPI003519FE41|nr:hypothetical protein FG386_003251 [Cryptosporidium ryanae]